MISKGRMPASGVDRSPPRKLSLAREGFTLFELRLATTQCIGLLLRSYCLAIDGSGRLLCQYAPLIHDDMRQRESGGCKLAAGLRRISSES